MASTETDNHKILFMDKVALYLFVIVPQIDTSSCFLVDELIELLNLCVRFNHADRIPDHDFYILLLGDLVYIGEEMDVGFL